jgi:hypothetical protein
MKISFLVLAHNNFIHLQRLLDALQDPDVHFYIHFDKKSNIDIGDFEREDVTVLSDRIDVHWGGFSIVEATMKLLNAAYPSNSDFYLLLSGTHYPVRSNAYIKKFLLEHHDHNFITVLRMPHNSKPLSRLENFFIEGGIRPSKPGIRPIIISAINYAIKKSGYKRRLPAAYSNYELYAGSQWWGFNHSFVAYLIEFLRNNRDFVNFYRHTLIPDEMFFHTIIMNSPFRNTVRNTFHYADWSIGKPPYPSLIEDIHLPILARETFSNDPYGEHELLFARKFDDHSSAIIKKIEEFRRSR